MSKLSWSLFILYVLLTFSSGCQFLDILYPPPERLSEVDRIRVQADVRQDQGVYCQGLPSLPVSMLLCVSRGQASYLDKGMKDRAKMYYACECRGARHLLTQAESLSLGNTPTCLLSSKIQTELLQVTKLISTTLQGTLLNMLVVVISCKICSKVIMHPEDIYCMQYVSLGCFLIFLQFKHYI